MPFSDTPIDIQNAAGPTGPGAGIGGCAGQGVKGWIAGPPIAPRLEIALSAVLPDVLDDARRALGPDPARALALARTLPPGSETTLLIGAAQRRLGEAAAAIATLTPLAAAQPKAWGVQFELGAALAVLGRAAEAEAALSRAVTLNPRSAQARLHLAGLRAEIGDLETAAADYAALAAEAPDQPPLWLSLGHVLKTLGRQAEAVATYRRALALAPEFGEAWWSLANLKTWRFAAADRDAMAAQLARPDLAEPDRAPLHFALAKALEDEARYPEAFDHYLAGNARHRARNPYDADANTAFVQAQIDLYTQAFFAAREGLGCEAPDPIFILGLPRSGSTLVEQILASHSAVEATAELPDLTAVAATLPRPYPTSLADLPPAVFADLGRDYLSRMSIQRRTDRPLFTDKFPNNFMHAGLIALILPKAKIIDVRRHPLACGLSGFKQLYAQGQAYSYDLADLGRYYTDYARLMAHLDAVLPGRIHRLSYEALVEDPETQIRALLAYCGLAFEPACLAFHETQRPVRTASSEQVRRPLNRDGLDQWTRFEPWLGPLKSALGPGLL
jgi:tetratricopeptide (TPR) repeat protein